MKWETVKLGNIIEPAKLRRAGQGTFPILSMTMHNGLVDQADKFKKRVASVDTSSYKVVRRKQLVVGFPIDEGVLSFQDLYDEAIVSPAYDIWNLKNQEQINTVYLERFLRSPQALSYYASKLRGTTARRRTIPDEIFLELQVPLPPIAEQEQIMARLDAANQLRAWRRDALARLAALTHSLFLDMFGDPAHNPKGWPMFSLAQLGKVSTGSTPPSSSQGMFDGAIPFVTPGDLDKNGASAKRTLTKAGAEKSRMVRSGSTMVCCIGATIGKMGKATGSSAFNQQINAVEWFDKVNDEFGYQSLRFFKQTIKTLGASTTLPILKKSSFEKIEIPVPPLSLQQEFADKVAQIEAVRARMEASRVELDGLFESLQNEAFGG